MFKVKDLYISASFKESLDFARKVTESDDCIFVLSSKHGLVDLDREIENYNVKQKDKSADDKAQWGEQVAGQLANRGVDIDWTEFIILAWGDYYRPLLRHLKYYKTPLKDVRVHDKSAKLKDLLTEWGK